MNAYCSGHLHPVSGGYLPLKFNTSLKIGITPFAVSVESDKSRSSKWASSRKYKWIGKIEIRKRGSWGGGSSCCTRQMLITVSLWIVTKYLLSHRQYFGKSSMMVRVGMAYENAL
jgi:hypothetical protein